jgi:hypothetical protein
MHNIDRRIVAVPILLEFFVQMFGAVVKPRDHDPDSLFGGVFLAGAVDVRGARCFAWRVLRVAGSPAERQGRLRRHARTRDPIELPDQRPELRRPAGLARRAGRRSRLRAVTDRTIDARHCTAGTPAPSACAFGYGGAFAGNYSGEHP